MKIMTVLGARPQFIKAGTISREIAKHNSINEIIVHTGQHYDFNMSDIFFEEMKIPKPNYFLGIGGMSQGSMTGQMIEEIDKVALKEKPDWILVYGDTNSTLAAGIVASKLDVRLAHIEAGLRSFNMKMPEEVNRILTDRVSDILFCPTQIAVDNLKNENYEALDSKIVKSGDVMQDGAIFYKKLALRPNFEIKKNYVLATVHRAENTNDINRLSSIIEALNTIHMEKQVIVPLHPRTKKIIESNKIKIEFTIIDPVGYLEMVWLIDNCDLIMTDSGGLQKEAFFFKKPCITLRDETEWVELVTHKFNVLTGSNKEKIIDIYENFSFNESFGVNLYGEGNASKKIVDELLEFS